MVGKTEKGGEGGAEGEAAGSKNRIDEYSASPSQGSKLKGAAHWARRQPMTQYIGTRWAERGMSSPGPVYYPNLSSFAKTPPKPYIPVNKGWVP